jgi:hypothetical protein
MGEKKIGIYGIKINNKWYIGSSIDLTTRTDNHYKELKLNKHVNLNLQRDYNNLENQDCTEEFDIRIIKLLPTNKILESWESYYMGIFNSIEKGYNNRVAVRPKITETIIKEVYKDLPNQPLMKLEDVCNFLNIDYLNIDEDIINGLPHISLGRNTIRFQLEEVKKYYGIK